MVPVWATLWVWLCLATHLTDLDTDPDVLSWLPGLTLDLGSPQTCVSGNQWCVDEPGDHHRPCSAHPARHCGMVPCQWGGHCPCLPPSLHSRLTFPCRAAVLLPTVCFLVWQRISGEGWRITVWVIKQQLEFSVNKGEIMYTESNHPNFICTKDGLGVYFYNHKIGVIWRDDFYYKILI